MVKKISVYGAKVICASCVGMPSSIETFEWLQAAIRRKYPEQLFQFEYIDIFLNSRAITVSNCLRSVL
ncbi:hypothetical protein GCM10020331_029050 [Ectobacillus funiculus]